jgi:hypothetical protein
MERKVQCLLVSSLFWFFSNFYIDGKLYAIEIRFLIDIWAYVIDYKISCHEILSSGEIFTIKLILFFHLCFCLKTIFELKLFQEWEKREGDKKKRMLERVNSTMIYCKNFRKCHHVITLQQSYDKNTYFLILTMGQPYFREQECARLGRVGLSTSWRNALWKGSDHGYRGESRTSDGDKWYGNKTRQCLGN